MPLENLVCDLDYAKRLKEIGITQIGHFLWKWYESERKHKLEFTPEEDYKVGEKDYCAFTISEMGAMMQSISNRIGFHNPTKRWTQAETLNPNLFSKQADAYANYLLYQIQERKALTVQECNKRIAEESLIHQPTTA